MPRGKKDNISKKIIKKIFNSFGLEIKRKNNFQDRYFDSVTEMTEREVQILNEISEIALSSVANQWSIIQSLKHIKEKNIPGEIVECGVYKGGSLILICLISQMIELSRAIIGFDTFEDGFDKISKFKNEFYFQEFLCSHTIDGVEGRYIFPETKIHLEKS